MLWSSVLSPGIWEAAGQPPVKLGEGRVMLSPAAEHRLNYSTVADFQVVADAHEQLDSLEASHNGLAASAAKGRLTPQLLEAR